jgi:hypothetical protein
MPSANLILGMKAIGKRGSLINAKQLARDIQRTNQKFAKRAKRRFQKTVRTWEHPVEFHQKTKSGAEPSVAVFTEDEIYGYVSDGTAIRYAVMTEDFSPKTRPGTLESRPGKGGFAYLDTKNPRPGIEARNFPELIESELKDDYEREQEANIDRAIERENR